MIDVASNHLPDTDNPYGLDQFTVCFYSDLNNKIDTFIIDTIVNSSIVSETTGGVDNLTAKTYSANLPSVKLDAGHYWLGVKITYNSPSNLYWSYAQNYTPNDSDYFGGYLGVSNTNIYEQEYVFSLSGNNGSDAFPETATMLLFGTGLAAGLAAARRRKKTC